MPKDANAPILGKSEDGKWYQIAYPDAARPSWVAAAFVNVTGAIEQVAVVVVTPPPSITPGGVALVTRAPTPTQVVTPPKGTIGFISWDKNAASYVLANIVLNPRSIASFIPIGPAPFDLSMSTNAAPFAWAPDGSGRVAYVFGRLGDPASLPNSLHVYSTANAVDQTLYTHQGIASPSWSPDARTIVYIGMDKAGVNYGSQSIYRILATGGTPDRAFPARGNESFRGVAWGKTWILFVSNQSGYSEIWRLDADFNPASAFPLTNDRRENGSPAWSPDGNRFAYYSKQVDGSYQIMVANADGSGQRKLTNAGNNFTPTWSPDGNWIAFHSDRGGRLDTYIMDKNGGNVQVLTDKYLTDCPPPQCQNQLPNSWR
jgi:Tol biopolymer transport system component